MSIIVYYHRHWLGCLVQSDPIATALELTVVSNKFLKKSLINK